MNAPKTYRDLMTVTGLGRDVTKAAIRSGELPGYVIGRRYVVPADAFDEFCKGRWKPAPRPVLWEDAKVKHPVDFVHRKEQSA